MFSTLPQLSPRAKLDRFHFIEQTLQEGWCMATSNTLDCVVRGNHDYGYAVAPDGSYGRLHSSWHTAIVSCKQTSPPTPRDCFGGFEVTFPAPIQKLEDFAEPFRQILPVIQETHHTWKKFEQLLPDQNFPVCLSGEKSLDVQLLLGNKKSPIELEELNRVISTVYEIFQHRGPQTTTLEVLKAAMSSTFQSIWHLAGTMLIGLSQHFPDAGETFFECMSCKQSLARLHAIQIIYTVVPPPDLRNRMLQKGLLDKSKKVREFSSARIDQFRIRELIPELEMAISIEKDQALKQRLMIDRSMLRFGVAVYQNQDEKDYDVLVRTKEGWGSSRPTPKRPFTQEKIVEHVRKLGGDPELAENWTSAEIIEP